MNRKSSGTGMVLDVADELVAAAEDQHAGQRDDERRDADVGDPEALPGADQGAEHQAEQDAQDQGMPQSRMAMATTMPTKAATEPTDRSMWPAMITITMPMARIRM